MNIEVREAADLIGNKGYAAIPEHMVGRLRASNCTGMQVFMLDFDDGIRFTDVKRKCEDMGFPISFAYHTFSSSEKKERFRVVFVYERLIEDTFIIKVMLKMLYSIFQGCDTSCSNLDRMFLGGKELIYLDESAHLSLMQIQKQFLSSIDKNNNFRRNIESFCKNNKLIMYFDLPAMGNTSFLHEFVKNDGNKDSLYDVWAEQGFLQTIEGDVIHYAFIEKFFDDLGKKFHIKEIAFDRWGAVQMGQNLEGLGFMDTL